MTIEDFTHKTVHRVHAPRAQRLTSFLRGFISKLRTIRHSSGPVFRQFFTRRSMKRNLPKTGILVIFTGVLILAATGAYRTTRQPQPLGAQDQSRISLEKPLSEQTIGKNLILPLFDEEEEQIADVTLTIDKAELRNEIIVKGKRAQSIEGRTFLVINLKITNGFDQAISIATRDYIRLSVNGRKDELLAPDIHNDPVEVQPISTKYTRVAFPINESDRNIVLLVGEISGEKEEIPLSVQ